MPPLLSVRDAKWSKKGSKSSLSVERSTSLAGSSETHSSCGKKAAGAWETRWQWGRQQRLGLVWNCWEIFKFPAQYAKRGFQKNTAFGCLVCTIKAQSNQKSPNGRNGSHKGHHFAPNATPLLKGVRSFAEKTVRSIAGGMDLDIIYGRGSKAPPPNHWSTSRT